MKVVKEYLIKACQIVLIIAILAIILGLTFAGGYLLYTTISWIVIKFIIGVASFGLGLAMLDFIRNEALRK